METDAKLDRIIIGSAAVAISGAILPILFANKGFNYVDGSPGYEMALGVCYAIAGLYALIHIRDVIPMAVRSRPLIAMIVVAFVSVLWAEIPSLAIRRSSALLGTTLIGVLLAARFTSTERLRLLSFVLRLLAVASLIFILFLPQYGIKDDLLHPGSWIGVFNHKNQLGAYAALAFLIDSYRPGPVWSKAMWFSLYVVLLVKSGSASPLAALLATWVVVAIFNKLRMRHRLSLRAIALSVAGAIALCLGVGLGSGLIQSVLGRSANLTGRGELWQALIPAIILHPFLGYGYGAFWAGGSKEYYDVLRQIHWDPMYAHNGYLEVLVSLGLAGLIPALWFFSQTGLYAALKADNRESLENMFPLALLIYTLIRNISECTILYHNSLEWAVCVATFLALLPASVSKRKLQRAKPSHVVLIASEEYA
jgi:exopolysaccharide production protein ExoQ